MKLLFFLVLLSQTLFAQNTADLTLYKTVKSIVKDSLKMSLHSRFFEEWGTAEKPSLFTYFSKKDTIATYYLPDSIKSKPKSAFEPFAKSKTYGDCDFLLYKTYGTAETYLTNHLLQYSKAAQAFIAFHEAMHHHCAKQEKRIPYIVEEALCDAFAAECTTKYADILGLETTDVVLQNAWNSVIYRFINNDIAQINATKNREKILKIHENFELFLQNMLPMANDFQRERFDYSISNAYFLRYQTYAWHYFTLRKILKNKKNITEGVFLIQKTWEENPAAFWKILE
jgi:hypothetical protein